MIYDEWEEVLYMNRYLLVTLTAYPKITGMNGNIVVWRTSREDNFCL
jgi:hypothetical protein